MPFCYKILTWKVKRIQNPKHKIALPVKPTRNFGKGLAVPGDQLGFLAILETKGRPPVTCQVVWDDFEKLVHLVGHPGESYIIYIYNWHEACWTDKSSQFI